MRKSKNSLQKKSCLEPVVTIGICVRNSEKTLEGAIDSVIEQNYPHELMEIIFVDDGSEDATFEIIADYMSKISINSRVFRTNWRGIGYARNLVADNARGEYVIWVDGDMCLTKSYVDQQVKFMQKNPSVGIAGGCFGLNSEDNWIATLENIGYVISRIRQSGKLTSNILGAGASIFRMKAIKEVDGFNFNIKGAQEDTDIARRIKHAGYSFYVTKAVFFHKQKRTWKDIWRSNYWYGYGLHFLKHQKKQMSIVRDKTEDRILLSFFAYKLTRKKIVFLLPLNFIFKKSALVLGYLGAHWSDYGHN